MSQSSTFKKPKILIVDDDATVRVLMRDALTDDIYDVVEACNGIEALDQIKQSAPDLVLLDVNMPGLDGFEVCNKIRYIYGDTDISIVMVTGLDDSESIEKAYRLGATDFISKPINWDTFPYRIQYLIKARNAIIETKDREIHLQYLEIITRIITQHKDHTDIMHETLKAMLDIFNANRVFLVKPTQDDPDELEIDYEVTSDDTTPLRNKQMYLYDTLGSYTLQRAIHNEYPILSTFEGDEGQPSYDSSLKQQMIKALHLQGNQVWFLILQQRGKSKLWLSLDEETFYKICLRLTGIISRNLLTEELHKSEQLLKQAQSIGHLGNWNWNVKINKLTWSDEIFRIYGFEKGRLTPDCEKFYKIKFEEDHKRHNLFNSIIDRSIESYQIDHRITTSSMNICWVREYCAGTYDENNNLIELNGIVQDITDAHIKKEQEVHNSKMDAIGQLTSGVAHDFGNLMTVAKGNLDLLLEDLARKSEINQDDVELLEDAHSAILDSVELTKQLLTFSRKKSIAPAAVNIESTVQNFRKLLKNTVGNAIQLNINIQDNLPNILVDSSQFESAVLNLVINARNAMPNGGSLTISAEEMATQHSNEIIRNADNDLGENCICLYFKDNGVGMTNEVLERAIEPFYTTNKTSGTGLGLSMVYGFVKQSAGELLIHSKPGKGTTIYMQFPIYADLVVEDDKQVREMSSLPESINTILVVEDQANVRQFAIRCLEAPGINILEAENAAAARKLLNEHDEIDLLFTDVLMPGDMNGHELASWANNHNPELKILLTTAMENKPSSEQPDRGHNFQLLPKPYNKNELTKSICKIS